MIRSFNHILLPSPDAPTYQEMQAFYRFLGLTDMPVPDKPRRKAVFNWYMPGGAEVHLMITDPDLAQFSPVGLNPSAQPHFGFEVDNADQMAEELESAGHSISTADAYGFPSRKQIYVTDPVGNVVELVEYRN